MNSNANPTAGTFSLSNLLSFFGAGHKSTSPAPSVEPVPEPVVPPGAPRILIVDDDAVILKTTALKLKTHGFAVSTAMDGPTAIHAARSEHPDLIMLDLGFPPDVAVSWDGFSIMNWLRRLESTKNVPIILFTGAQGDALYQRAQAAGAAGFFHKPLNYGPLISLIQMRLKSSPAKLPSTSDGSLRKAA